MSLINDHLWTPAVQRPSPNRGGRITPRFIVMHYTAGFTADSAVATLTRRGSRVSAHVTVDLDGTIIQHVPFNIKAWHAGPSRHMGYSGLNGHSIGIEIVNAGWFRKSGTYYVRNSLRVPATRMPPMIEAPNSRVGSGMLYWPQYTKRQLDSVQQLTEGLLVDYPIIDIVTHEEIDTRGWKTDPGPAFPINRYRKLLGERSVDNDMYEVTASSLNVRKGPGSSYSVSHQLSRGTSVNDFGRHGNWVRIDDDGWVHGAYLRRV